MFQTGRSGPKAQLASRLGWLGLQLLPSTATLLDERLADKPRYLTWRSPPRASVTGVCDYTDWAAFELTQNPFYSFSKIIANLSSILRISPLFKLMEAVF